MFKFLLSLMLTLYCVSFVTAQDSDSKNDLSKQNETKTVISSENSKSLEDIKTQTKKLKSKGSIKFKYDRFKDSTIVFSEPQNLAGFGEQFGNILGTAVAATASGTNASVSDIPGLSIQIFFRFDKNILDKDVEKFVLVFNSYGKTWRILKDKELNVIADGERLSFGEGELDTEIGSISRSPVTVESLLFEISKADLRKLAEAKQLEIQIGKREQKLKDKNKQIFKDMLSLGTISQVEDTKK